MKPTKPTKPAATAARNAPKKKPEPAPRKKSRNAGQRTDLSRTIADINSLRKAVAALRLSAVDLFTAFACIPAPDLDALNRPEADRDWRLFALSYDVMDFRRHVKALIQEFLDAIAAAQAVATPAAPTAEPSAAKKGKDAAR